VREEQNLVCETPICDFVCNYNKSGAVRLHMPGHKGRDILGVEALDITEIAGADSLYEAEGIIARSEKNASALFGSAQTFYSTEGSSQCIRAMLFLALMRFKEQYGGKLPTRTHPIVVAARNAHKAFLMAAALLDFDIVWLWDEREDTGQGEDLTLCRCMISKEKLDGILSSFPGSVMAVYLTSPDYLGGILDIRSLAEVTHRYGTLLLVDNAHGAYLHFLANPLHPLDLGADLCCDSAHKTLPVLTGGAYLHISGAVSKMAVYARQALALFGSTSPSYLILQSLDLANRYLMDGYPYHLERCVKRLDALREELRSLGWFLEGDEVLKLTIATAKSGYYGEEFAAYLRAEGIECEYADPDFVVLMFTPENGEEDFERLCFLIKKMSVREAICRRPPTFLPPRRMLSVREAVFSSYEILPTKDAVGRVMGPAAYHCPPAVPIVVSGEEICPDAVQALLYYGVGKVGVVR